jgi:ferredoxin
LGDNTNRCPADFVLCDSHPYTVVMILILRNGCPRTPSGNLRGVRVMGRHGVTTETETDQLQVWVDQDLCTGDGLCVQYAPEVFEFDIDGLAYVKDGAGELLQSPGVRTDVPERLRLEVIDAAKECPGDCIHVVRSRDDVEVAGPDAD